MSDYFPTKYSSAADEVIAGLSCPQEGYGSLQSGDVEAPTGHFRLVVLDDRCDLAFAETSDNFPQGDYVGETARAYGVTAEDVKGAHVVVEDDRGFVGVHTFDSPELAREAWDELEAEYVAWLGDDEDGEAVVTTYPGRIFLDPETGELTGTATE